jgi:hypothetical protein
VKLVIMKVMVRVIVKNIANVMNVASKSVNIFCLSSCLCLN